MANHTDADPVRGAGLRAGQAGAYDRQADLAGVGQCLLPLVLTLTKLSPSLEQEKRNHEAYRQAARGHHPG